MLQTFLPLFIMTFGICLFIVLMQFLWRYIDDMVGKGLGISMMSELMIRGNTEDVYCVPVSPTCIREIGMGMKPGTEENGSIAKLRECVMQFVSTLNKGGNVSLK